MGQKFMIRKPRHTVSLNELEIAYIIGVFGKMREDSLVVNKFVNAQQALDLKIQRWRLANESREKKQETDTNRPPKRTRRKRRAS